MSDTNINFQAIPPADSWFLTINGGVNPVWYRFLNSLWQHVSEGTPSTITLQGAHNIANTAQATAVDASNDVVAERARAQLVEGSLQGEIDTLNTHVTTLQTAVATLQSTVTSLQSQINTINSRLAAAGIP